MRGHYHRQSATSWRLMVEAPRDPDTGKRRQVTRTVKGSQRDAERALAALVAEVDGGLHYGPDMTVAQLLDVWLERRRRRAELEVSTWDDYRRVADQLIVPTRCGPGTKPFGERKLARLKVGAIDDLYDALIDQGLGPARIRRAHSVLQGALKYAVRKEWIARNWAGDAEPPTVKRKKVRASALEAVITVLEYARDNDPEVMAWLFVAAVTGARRGEVCGIEWGDLDADAGTLLLVRSISTPKGRFIVKSTKTENDHPIAVDELTLAVLAAHKLRAKALALKWGYSFDEATPMFISPWSRRHWRGDVTGHRIADLCKAAGVKINPLGLRHFHATQLIAAGFDPVTVSGRQRHARTSTTTDIYAESLPPNDRKAAAFMGKLVSGS